MSSFDLLSRTMGALSGRVNYLTERHNLLTQNVAQLETPGYQAKDLDFQGFVENEIAPGSVSLTPDERVVATNSPNNPNGNNVSLETEMGKIADNSLEYMTALEVLKKNIGMVKAALDR